MKPLRNALAVIFFSALWIVGVISIGPPDPPNILAEECTAPSPSFPVYVDGRGTPTISVSFTDTLASISVLTQEIVALRKQLDLILEREEKILNRKQK